jgi:hypothetical protein
MIKNIFKMLSSRIRTNSNSSSVKFWQRVSNTLSFDFNNGETRILIEGLLRTPKNNIEKLIIAKLLSDKNKSATVDVITKHAIHRTDSNAFIYQLSNVNRLYALEFLFRFKIIINTLRFFLGNSKMVFSATNFIKLQFMKIPLGELICDTIIRNEPSVNTFSDVRVFKKLRLLFLASYYIAFYNSILKKTKYDYLIISHKSYLVYGILFYLARFYNVTVILRDNNVLKVYDGSIPDKEHFLKVETKLLNISLLDPISINEANQHLDNRFSGQLDQIDVNNAFKNKKSYTREALSSHLNLNTDLPIVLIMPHAFSDSPHCGTYLAFDDYYDWLVETTKAALKNPNCNFIIKPHPSSYFWGEKGIVESILEMLDANNRIKIVPSDFNTNSFIDCSDIVLTVQGTIGLESICCGIPSYTCGGGYYSGNFKALEFSSADDYVNKVENISIKTIPVISDSESLKAKMILWLSHTQLVHSSLVSNDNILPNENFADEETKLLNIIGKQLDDYQYTQDPLLLKLNSLLEND